MKDVLLPGGIRVRAGSVHDQDDSTRPDWGVYTAACCTDWPGSVLEWPDHGVPEGAAATVTAIRAILEAYCRARKGQNILVSCRDAAGRTGTILACLAHLAGVPLCGAVTWVRRNYRADAVETGGQQQWVAGTFARHERVAARFRDSWRCLVGCRCAALRQEACKALQCDLDAPTLVWAIPNQLAITQRPLRVHPRYCGSGHGYPPEARTALEEWTTRLRKKGVRSVVVLTSYKELQYYDAATKCEGGLLRFHDRRGLAVAHFPADDPAHGSAAAFCPDEIAAKVVKKLPELPCPVVLHCSAAIDRSPPVAARVSLLIEFCGP